MQFATHFAHTNIPPGRPHCGPAVNIFCTKQAQHSRQQAGKKGQQEASSRQQEEGRRQQEQQQQQQQQQQVQLKQTQQQQRSSSSSSSGRGGGADAADAPLARTQPRAERRRQQQQQQRLCPSGRSRRAGQQAGFAPQQALRRGTQLVPPLTGSRPCPAELQELIPAANRAWRR